MKTTAKPINSERTVTDQFLATNGHIFSLQTRTFPSGVNAIIIEEFFAQGVKSYTKRWQSCQHAKGPVDWVIPQWEALKRSHHQGE